MHIKTLLLGMAVFLVIGCTDHQIAPPSQDADGPVASAVDVQEYSYPYDMDLDLPYENCATGEEMQNHGTVLVHVREKTTPSGNVIVSGWVDYDAFDGIILEGLSSGEVWTLTNGHNPFGEVIKDNGSYLLHYHWNELYANSDRQRLHIHLKGHVRIDPDGTVRTERESYTCR